jgi:hypothetical protein
VLSELVTPEVLQPDKHLKVIASICNI